MNPLFITRKIRACEGEAAAQLLLEKYAEFVKQDAITDAMPAVQPVMAGTEIIGYVKPIMPTTRFEFFNVDDTSQNMRAAMLAVYAAPVAPVTEREGFYEKLWRDFLSLQSGDIQLMGKEAERYRFIRDSEGACIATNELHALDQIPLGDKLDAAIDAAMLAAAPTPPEAAKKGGA